MDQRLIRLAKPFFSYPENYIHMQTEQTYRLFSENKQGGKFIVTIWNHGKRKGCFQGKYRVVKTRPSLELWSHH